MILSSSTLNLTDGFIDIGSFTKGPIDYLYLHMTLGNLFDEDVVQF
jgi:hypothetical protein